MTLHDEPHQCAKCGARWPGQHESPESFVSGPGVSVRVESPQERPWPVEVGIPPPQTRPKGVEARLKVVRALFSKGDWPTAVTIAAQVGRELQRAYEGKDREHPSVQPLLHGERDTMNEILKGVAAARADLFGPAA